MNEIPRSRKYTCEQFYVHFDYVIHWPKKNKIMLGVTCMNSLTDISKIIN